MRQDTRKGQGPHGLSSLGAHGKHRGWRSPGACVPTQHLVLRQLDQVLQPLLVHLPQQIRSVLCFSGVHPLQSG